ncbi:MAG: DNA repair protein RecO [Planctomycetota bacterium]
MSPNKDLAIVLRLSDFAETSQIATVFTAGHGQLRLIAKGARRGTKTRFAAGLDLLEHGELGFLPARGDAQLGVLTDWQQRASFAGLRRDLPRLYASLYAAELVAGLTEEADPHPELFAALVHLLDSLTGEGAVGALVAWFQHVLLREIGYAPVLTDCVECGRRPARGAPVFFSAAAGGLLCRDCEVHHVDKRRISPRLLEPEGAPDPSAQATDAARYAGDPAGWFDLFDYYLTHLAGKRFKTAARLAELLARGTQVRL